MTTLQNVPTSTAAAAAAMGGGTKASAMSPASRRMIAAIVFLACGAVLGVAAWLEPSPTGMGTHTQLRLPACGWIMIADLPCPTCGMTTAFAHAANGNLKRSFLAQPLGGILAVFTAMIFLVSIQVMITGSRLGSAMSKLWTRHVAWALAAAVVAAWAFKIVQHKGWL